ESLAPVEFSILGCKAGWYGSVCDKQCSDKCLPDSNGNITCRQNDGRCTTGCKAGWYGSVCDRQCSDKCRPENNGNIACRQNDGRCTAGD
ncbi:hypothetical protein BaRGS_00015156, partial [Batillaria attramentaria]